MTTAPATSAATSVFSPLDPKSRSLGWKIGAVMIGTIILALSSYVEVPMVPVPITMQTFAVVLVGALYGWRLGVITITTWLVQGAIGMPVLAGGAAGAQHFVGPTGGYLFAFPIAGSLMGWFAERGWNGSRVWLAFVGMVLSHAVCLLLGAAWLAVIIGTEQAIIYGLTPFFVGALVKSALGAATLKLLTRGRMRRVTR